jgi:hypothetical protein
MKNFNFNRKGFPMKRQKLPPDWEHINLCYLANLGYQVQGTRKYKSLARKPEFYCKVCGRAASESENLCRAEHL